MSRDGRVDVGLTTVTSRTVLPSPHDASGRAEFVAERLRDAIRLGLVLDGERLPAEPVLADQMGVATVTLREALSALRAEGLIVTRRGRGGGSFVRVEADRVQRHLAAQLTQWSVQDLREIGDHRAAVSGAAAALAADRALPAEVARMHAQLERLAAASSTSERRRADTQFTIEIAAAAQTSRLAREEVRLRAEVGDLLWLSHDDDEHRQAVRSRRRLVTAIGSRRRAAARSLAERLVWADMDHLIRLRLDAYAISPRSPGFGAAG